MNSCIQKDYRYEETKTEPNYKIKLNKRIFNELNYNIRKISPFRNIQNKENIDFNQNAFYNNNPKNKFLEKNYSFSFVNNPKDLFLKKNILNKSNNRFENSSMMANKNKSIYENKYYFKKSNSIIYDDSRIKNNLKNQDLTYDFKINKLLNNNIKNNKLKNKINNLLDLALKKDKIFSKFQNNNETNNMHRMEMTIERIRNINRKEIFKKKIHLNLPGKRIITNGIKSKKRKISEKLLEKINKSQLYKSINYKDNTLYQEKRNKSFKNSFIHLNNDFNFITKKFIRDNSFKIILNNQNIYRPNSKIDYNKKIIEKEKNQQTFQNYNKNESKIKYKLKHLRADLNFF